jgi:hypothetical protein
VGGEGKVDEMERDRAPSNEKKKKTQRNEWHVQLFSLIAILNRNRHVSYYARVFARGFASISVSVALGSKLNPFLLLSLPPLFSPSISSNPHWIPNSPVQGDI